MSMCCFRCGAGSGDFHSEYGNLPVLLRKTNEGAICTLCEEGLGNIVPDRPALIKLKAQIRKARAEDQRALLDWLEAKFADAR